MNYLHAVEKIYLVIGYRGISYILKFISICNNGGDELGGFALFQRLWCSIIMVLKVIMRKFQAEKSHQLIGNLLPRM